jgi:hypothetical protein
MTLAVTYADNNGDPADLLEITEIADPPPPRPGQIQIDVRAFHIQTPKKMVARHLPEVTSEVRPAA